MIEKSHLLKVLDKRWEREAMSCSRLGRNEKAEFAFKPKQASQLEIIFVRILADDFTGSIRYGISKSKLPLF